MGFELDVDLNRVVIQRKRQVLEKFDLQRNALTLRSFESLNL